MELNVCAAVSRQHQQQQQFQIPIRVHRATTTITCQRKNSSQKETGVRAVEQCERNTMNTILIGITILAQHFGCDGAMVVVRQMNCRKRAR